jgi:hypothetical protein
MADFTGYDDYSLLGMYQWWPGFFGVVMLRLVYALTEKIISWQ